MIYTKTKIYILNVWNWLIKRNSLFICSFISFLERINNGLLNKLNIDKEYESLSPKDDLEKDNSYINALKESIEDSKRRNIAISGIYGSGKSSIIESFKKHHKEYKYLDISLATFISNDKDSLADKLERNILNQIFYKVKHSKMPYSRFRKIKNIKFLNILKLIIINGLLIISLVLLIKPQLIETFRLNVLKLKELLSEVPILGYNTNLSVAIIVFVCIVTIFSTSIFLYKVMLSKFTISKVQTKDGSVQVGKIEENETFNKYLDEIMYFFESAKYDVVFFEDLDRFDNLEIFTKLRELNTLINNSEAIDRKVTFVYAIKDEIFFIEKGNDNCDKYKYIDKKDLNKNRTKFFDFIIPVIPIVNGENSYEILTNKVDRFNKLYGEEEYLISKELISDISLFIDDMRLLTNIYNEFLVYYKRLVIEGVNKTLIIDNLLAIIVYKNLYPVDFTKLQNQDGMVYNVFRKKNEIVDKAMQELNKEIVSCKVNIQHLQKEICENEEELYFIYNNEWKTKNINYIRTNSRRYAINQLIEVDTLEELKNSESISYSYNDNSYNWNDISFQDLMTINGTKGNYYERLLAIKSKGDNIEAKISNNRKNISDLESKIKEFKDSSIKTLMKDDRFFNSVDENIKKEPLITRLLKYGYIDEMYSYYSLYFYPGRLTKEDFEFVQNVMHNKPSNYNFKLTNLADILDKFRIDDFKSLSILNYDLIKFLSEHVDMGNNKLRLGKLIELLSELKEEYIKFIMNFVKINKNEDISNFIKLLCNMVEEFWTSMYISNYISLDDKDLILELILKYSSVNDILIQNDEGFIKNYIESRPNFIKSIGVKIDESKLNEILIQLNVKLKNIDEDIVTEIINNSNDKYIVILNMIYDSNFYDINSNMISLIVALKKNNLEDIHNINLNYSSIESYELENLKKYIDDNINLYMKNIFTKEHIKENTDTIIKIINNENVDMDYKSNIIRNKEFKIEDINEIEEADIWNLLIDNLKVKYSWQNVLSYYKNKDNIDSHLSEYINNSQVYNTLLEDILYYDDIDDEENNQIDSFVESFIKSNSIKNQVISLLSCKLGSPFEEFEFDDLSNERIKILIDKGLITLSKSIYKSLRTSHYEININLLEKHIEKFIEDKFQPFDENDLELVMKSINISEDNKYKVLQIYIDGLNINKNIADVIFESVERILSEEELAFNLIKKLVNSELNKKNKIKLISYQIKYLEKTLITELLINIDDEYYGLLDLSYENMYISSSSENRLLLEELKIRRYISSYKLDKTKILVHRKRS